MLTIAEIISDVFAAVGNPPQDSLSVRDVVRTVRNRLAYRLTRVAQSDQNHTTTLESFRLTAREQSLSNTAGAPAWAERRVWAGATNNSGIDEGWEFVPTVNLDSLEDFRNEGLAAVSFYRDLDSGEMRMRFSFDPLEYSDSSAGDNFRIWFDPSVATQSALESASDLPPNFNFMIADEAIISVIPLLMNNAARFTNSGSKQISDLQINAWQALAQTAAQRLVGWEAAFEEYRLRSKGSQKGRSRRNILRRNIAW